MGYNKENAIMAQNSATVAAALVGTGASIEEFERVRQLVFQGTLELAGVESVVRTFEAPTSVADAVRPEAPRYEQWPAQEVDRAFPPTPMPAASSGGGYDPSGPGGVVLKFGKYKGKTIGEVWNDPTPDRDGSPAGRGWLEWAAANTNNDFVKSKIREFLASQGASV